MTKRRKQEESGTLDTISTRSGPHKAAKAKRRAKRDRFAVAKSDSAETVREKLAAARQDILSNATKAMTTLSRLRDMDRDPSSLKTYEELAASFVRAMAGIAAWRIDDAEVARVMATVAKREEEEQ